MTPNKVLHWIDRNILELGREMRFSYLPPLMVYMAAGIQVDLIDGPFSVLEGHWHFNPLAMPGDDAALACRIEFEMRYAFSSMPLEAVLSPVFDRVANTFVDSFVRRAEQVYGPR